MSFVMPRTTLLQALKFQKPASSSNALVRCRQCSRVPISPLLSGLFVSIYGFQIFLLLKISLGASNGRFTSKTLKFSSASCQQSLEVGDNSAGEVHEEVQAQQIATLQDQKREEPVKRAEILERVPLLVSSEPEQEGHLRGFPLRVVVESCVKRWFKEQLKAAEKGDSDAQVTVGQMICHGYGVPKDAQKGEEWLKRAQCRRKSKQSKEPQDKKRQENDEIFFM